MEGIIKKNIIIVLNQLIELRWHSRSKGIYPWQDRVNSRFLQSQFSSISENKQKMIYWNKSIDCIKLHKRDRRIPNHEKDYVILLFKCSNEEST